VTQPHRAIFVDTSAFFALAETREANHQSAQDILSEATGRRTPPFTSNYIIAETHALLLTRLGRDRAARFLLSMDGTRVSIVQAGVEQEAAAREIIYRYADRSFSLTDAISFVLMEQLGITTAFTFDSDFRQYGFATAQP
jgi:predicted nucleic acid-binding protein